MNNFVGSKNTEMLQKYWNLGWMAVNAVVCGMSYSSRKWRQIPYNCYPGKLVNRVKIIQTANVVENAQVIPSLRWHDLDFREADLSGLQNCP